MSNQPTRMDQPIRPIPSRSQNISFSNFNTQSADIIRYTLNNLSPTDLHTQIMNGMNHLHQIQVDSLLAALRTGGVVTDREVAATKDASQRHCARCHKGYLERSNGFDACQVFHCRPEVNETSGPAFGTMTDATNVHISTTDPALFGGTNTRNSQQVVPIARTVLMKVEVAYICCGIKVKLGANVNPCCFKGRHTTRPENVRYNAKNIRSCDHMGCLRYRPFVATQSIPTNSDIPAAPGATQS